MLEINIQLFGGRGGSGGMSTGKGSGSVAGGSGQKQYKLRALTDEEKQAFTDKAREQRQQPNLKAVEEKERDINGLNFSEKLESEYVTNKADNNELNKANTQLKNLYKQYRQYQDKYKNMSFENMTYKQIQAVKDKYSNLGYKISEAQKIVAKLSGYDFKGNDSNDANVRWYAENSYKSASAIQNAIGEMQHQFNRFQAKKIK